MNCAEAELRLIGEPDDPAATQHAAGCAACRETLAAYAELRAAYAATRAEGMPPETRERALALSPRHPLLPVVGIAASTLLAAGLAWLATRPDPVPPVVDAEPRIALMIAELSARVSALDPAPPSDTELDAARRAAERLEFAVHDLWRFP